MLGWQPRTPLKEGLIQTIAYFEEMLKDKSTRSSLLKETRAAAKHGL